MASILGPGDVVWDIGAEEMDMTALFASWVAPEGGVVVFEPNCKVWPNGRAIFEANGLGLPLATFVGFAADVERQPAGAEGLAVNGWPACADGPVIGDHGFCNVWERPDLAAIKIDTLAMQVASPTAITVDVEGAELRVMRGAERVLREHRPKVWISVHPQFMADTLGDDAADLHAFMGDLGYTSELLAVDHEEHFLYLP